MGRNRRYKRTLCFVVFAMYLWPEPLLGADRELDADQLLKQLVKEVPEIRMITPEELEPNPTGDYHRYAFIRRDFNGDGVEDIAIAGTDAWVQKGASRDRNGYIVIASRTRAAEWVRVFLHKFSGLASPFLIWDRSSKALVVGANQSDADPGDIVWNGVSKKYRLAKSGRK